MEAERREVVREVWRRQLRYALAFRLDGLTIKFRQAVEDGDNWIRAVRLGDQTTLSVFGGCNYFDEVDPEENDLLDPDVMRRFTGNPEDQLGPAQLFYFFTDSDGWSDIAVDMMSKDAPAIEALIRSCSFEDANEASMADSDSQLSVIVSDGKVLAASGWTVWEPGIAHMRVLTHPDERRKGLGAQVASHATQRALGNQLVPQWRAARSNEASIAMAHALGYEPFGTQLSFRMI